MRREQDDLPRLAPAVDDRPNHLLRLGIDPVERLVEEEDVGGLREGPRDEDPLLLPA